MFSNCKMFIGFGYCQQRGVTVVFLFLMVIWLNLIWQNLYIFGVG